MYSRNELIKLSRHYFESDDVNVMIATTDGNFFHENARHYASSHAQTLKTPIEVITRADVTGKKDAPQPTEKQLLQDACTDAGYPQEEWGTLTKTELKAYVADKEAQEETARLVAKEEKRLAKEAEAQKKKDDKEAAKKDEGGSKGDEDSKGEGEDGAEDKGSEGNEDKDEGGSEDKGAEGTEKEESKKEDTDKNQNTTNPDDLIAAFEKESGKNAIWRGNETKDFVAWKASR